MAFRLLLFSSFFGIINFRILYSTRPLIIIKVKLCEKV